MTTGWLKKLSVVLALCLMLGCAAGCGGDGAASGTGEATSETGEAGTAEAEDKVIAKVGYIFMGDCDIESAAMEANEQRLAAAVHTDIESCYIDNVTITDFEAAVDKLVENGCNYIVSTSPNYTNVLTEVAGANMNINFISYGARVRSVNIYAYTDQLYEGAYIAGMAAAFNSKTEKIGIVVDTQMIYPVAAIDAAVLGTQLVYKDATLYPVYATEKDEIHKAVDALANQGCDVIISYTNLKETVEYCEQKGIKVIGNHDYSENAKDYENLLMYFYSDHDSFYLSQFKQMDLETWQPQSYVGTIGNGVVAVSAAQECAADGTQDVIDVLVPKIATGEGYIFSGEIKSTAGNVIVQQSHTLSPAEVYGLDWYFLGVDPVLGSYVQQKTELEINDFEIKK